MIEDPGGERKQVTVLFADVAGSTELSSRLDPEVWQGVIKRVFAHCSEAVEQFEGTVVQFTGDGALAVFGAPVAHEDHAFRACQAGLELQRRLIEYASELRAEHGLELAMRVGLNSGEVVAGEISGGSYTAIGGTVSLAKRTEEVAQPGSVFMTENTAALVEGYLDLEDRGDFEAKGIEASVRLFEVAAGGAVRGRVDVSLRRGLTTFTGRDLEMQELEAARAGALAGHGQVVGIVGEAGIGKSRVSFELARLWAERRLPVYRMTGMAHSRSVSLLPVLQFLREFFGVDERDQPDAARARVVEQLTAIDAEPGSDELQVLLDTLGIADESDPGRRIDPGARQRRLSDLMQRAVEARGTDGQVLYLIEDAQWLDPASDAFCANLIEALSGTHDLAVVNFRPGYEAPWMTRSFYRQIALAPLDRASTAWLVADLLGPDPSLTRVAELIAMRSDGNPFFVEEIVQDLVEAGKLAGRRGDYRLAGEVDAAAVPATLQATLSARIDRLGEREKAVLGAAAVVGRHFAEPVLRRVTGLDPDELAAALGELENSALVFRRTDDPAPVYAFKHALTQQVAYQSQLRDRRQALHGAVAAATAAEYPDRLDERAALIAGHYDQSGDRLEAARWNARAGAWAGTGDPESARARWKRVRDLCDGLEPSDETIGLGLGARTSLLHLGWRLGISQDDADSLFREAEELAARVGEPRLRAPLLVYYGAIKAMSTGEMRESARLQREALELVEQAGDAVLFIAIANSAWVPLYLLGEFESAIELADRALELADGDPAVGMDLGIPCPYAHLHAVKGFNLAMLGEAEEAARLLELARDIAAEQNDIEVVGFAHGYSVIGCHLIGDVEAAHRHAQQALEIAERIGDSFFRSHAWFYLGVAERLRERWHLAIEAINRAEAIAREHNTGVENRPTRLAFLAESLLGLGEYEQALPTALEGVELARAQENVPGELAARLAHARVLRAAGGADQRDAIEATCEAALELARATGARATELLIEAELAELATAGS